MVDVKTKTKRIKGRLEKAEIGVNMERERKSGSEMEELGRCPQKKKT